MYLCKKKCTSYEKSIISPLIWVLYLLTNHVNIKQYNIWALSEFNKLYPGELILTWAWSDSKLVFLNIELIINRDKNIIETKYYIKPTNQRLFLNFRSNHPQHVFRAVVYGMALQGLLVNSRNEWNFEYLKDLREKFLQQEYPMDLINSQFSKALEVDRLDLLFKSPAQRKKSKKRAPLVLTFNPGNPPVKSWINEELTNLYQDPKMKKTFPNIDVVYRQNRNIRTRIMRNRYTKRKEDQNQVVTNRLEISSSTQPDASSVTGWKMGQPNGEVIKLRENMK